MKNHKFLRALRCENDESPPIWLMRQAGRYLPSYQALRQKYSLYDLFFTPELACEVTLLPLQTFPLDAAILFSDITVVAKMFDLSLDFIEGVGPVISPRIEKISQIEALPGPSVAPLASIGATIDLLKKELTCPLIGFCGGPFTVASYMIEKRAGPELPLIKQWLYQQPEALHKLLRKLTDATKLYLEMQLDRGVDAVQIFDSWAHVLTLDGLKEFCLPYHKELIQTVQQKGVPVISFMRSSSLHVREIAEMQPDAISFDWQRPLFEMRKILHPRKIAVQGNLDPDLLFASKETIDKNVQELLSSMEGDRGFIVNLGHGVKPGTLCPSVRCLIDSKLKCSKFQKEPVGRVL